MFLKTKKTRYQRILLKISGEYLKNTEIGIDPQVLDKLAHAISNVVSLGVEVALVIGGGNLFRGKTLSEVGIERITGDHMGMFATVMNSLALRDALEKVDLPARVMSAIPMSGVVDAYDRRKALKHLKDKKVLIFSAGTGNPLFTTDTAASLRAVEINADVILKGTKVNGVYDADPKVVPDAKMYSIISYEEIINKSLGIMDLTAICMCRDYKMPIHVFNICEDANLINLISGDDIGTIVLGEKEIN